MSSLLRVAEDRRRWAAVTAEASVGGTPTTPGRHGFWLIDWLVIIICVLQVHRHITSTWLTVETSTSCCRRRRREEFRSKDTGCCPSNRSTVMRQHLKLTALITAPSTHPIAQQAMFSFNAISMCLVVNRAKLWIESRLFVRLGEKWTMSKRCKIG